MEQNAVIIGEVLFDRFPGQQSILGGAPFNVAWHLQGFGLAPLFVSCVGRDAAGSQVVATMEQWGMDTRGVQVNPDYPTGAVQVSLSEGQPSFDILPQQAYDYIEADPAAAAIAGRHVDLIYMGTLAARNPVSRATLHTLVEGLRVPVFVDVNLRSPWWDRERVLQTLAGARWVKLNDEELRTIAGADLAAPDLIPATRALRERFDLELLILTLGADGAVFVTATAAEQGNPVPVPSLVDTVGAGDAFSAVTLLGLMHDWSLPVTLQRALQFAARICGQRGATAMDYDLYREFLGRWNP